MTGASTAALERPGGSAAATGLVHVVTVTHNSATTLDAYFAGVARCAPHIAAVTVVDNASTDDTVARLRAAAERAAVPVCVVENENTGFAGGYAAAARGTGPRDAPVLCLNPDVALADGAVEAMLDVLASFPDAGVVTVPLVESDGTPDSASRRRLPTLGGSMVYSVLGRLTPASLRYNRREEDAAPSLVSDGGLPVSPLAATTGAVMLVAREFRSLEQGVFDTEYWMYGEDLQLCADAAAQGLSVLIAEVPPSVHVKGVSSGRPRSRRSNHAFHDAMYRYARKNLVRNPLLLGLLRVGVWAHFGFSEASAAVVRQRRRRAARTR